MKKIAFVITAIVTIIITACNNNKSSKENEISKMDTTKNVQADTTPPTEVNHIFTNVDPHLAASLKIVVDHYLQIKNALVDDSGKEAANGGKEMAQAMSEVDKSLFSAEQKKIYDGIEDDLKEHAEHIGENAKDIAHQREHFSMMSEDVFDLVKAFGYSQILYHDHCPMANDNKGGMWLSEMKEIKNPYFAGKMNNCVTIPEVIK